MAQPIYTRERVTFVNDKIWEVYAEVYKTVKHIYIKPRGYAFYKYYLRLKGKEYKEDYMYHACKFIKRLKEEGR